MFQHMLKPEPADIRCQRRAGKIRKAGAVSNVEFRAPVDQHIAWLRLRRAVRIGGDKDQLLLEQMLDL